MKTKDEFRTESITDSPAPLISDEERIISEFASMSMPDEMGERLYRRLDRIIELLERLVANSEPVMLTVAGVSREFEWVRDNVAPPYVVPGDTTEDPVRLSPFTYDVTGEGSWPYQPIN